MKISDRFLDYGLTGGFFWAVQIILLILFFPSIWHTMGVMAIGAIPENLSGSANSIFAALGIIAIFFTGALLDLFAPFYSLAEMFEIRKHLVSEANREWLKKEVKNSKKFLIAQKYLETLCILQDNNIDGYSGIEWICFLSDNSEKIESKKSSLLRVLSYPRKYFSYLFLSYPKTRELVQACQSFIAFFNSYLLKNSEASQLEMLMDQMHLWRAMRAFATAITLLSFELVALLIGTIVLSPLPDLKVRIVIVLIISLSFSFIFYKFIANYIIRISFSRLCITMLSLMYLTIAPSQEDSPSSEHSGSEPSPRQE